MPAAHAHENNMADTGSSFRDGLVRPADIDRVLVASADPRHARDATLLRLWRDDLAFARSCLEYAETVLAADVAILRHCLATAATRPSGASQRVDTLLPSVVRASASSAPLWPPESDRGDGDLQTVQTVLAADPLISSHIAIARLDLDSPEDVNRVLRVVQDQLTEVATRRKAVASRLEELHTSIVASYREGEPPTLERPA